MTQKPFWSAAEEFFCRLRFDLCVARPWQVGISSHALIRKVGLLYSLIGCPIGRREKNVAETTMLLLFNLLTVHLHVFWVSQMF